MAIDESTIIIGEPTPDIPVPESGASVFVMLRMILVLALAALAIYGVVYFIKRMSKPQVARDPHLKVLARVPLSGDTFAAVLSVGAKAWLVGGGSGGLNLISEIDETESLEAMLIDEARKTSETGTRPLVDFRSLMARFGKGNQQPLDNSHAEALRKQRERLKDL